MNPRPKPRPLSLTDDWTARAACAGRNPDIWFPRTGEGAGPARAICFECPVIKQCDAYIRSVPARNRYGVWAGVFYHGE